MTPLNDVSELLPQDSLPRRRIEAIFDVGLPVLGGPWIGQYAKLIADAEGACGVIHIQQEQVEIELFQREPDPHDQLLGAVDDAETRSAFLPDLIDTLERLSDQRGLSVDRWLLRTRGTVSQKQHLAAPVPHWTMLCGASDTSLVQIYSLLKHLTHAGRAGDRWFGLGVMGADRTDAITLTRRLNVITGSMLRHTIELLAVAPRIRPIRRETIGVFACPAASGARLEDWMARYSLASSPVISRAS